MLRTTTETPNGREADIILNEITTNRVSNINGYVEIAGRRADLIIANPNGISVSGAGFINTNRLSMITGSSIDPNTNTSFNSNTNLNPFILTDTNKNPNAIIQVIGKNVFDRQGNQIAYNLGIDAHDVKYADLISRVVKINGNIVGSDKTEVAVKTGNDKAYYNLDENGNKNTNGFKITSKDNKDNQASQDNQNNTNKPEFAIDSTAFGGIYAGRIQFIATEDGVGVRTRSDLIASTDDINFDINGNIIFEEEGSLQAKRNVNLNNQSNTTNHNSQTLNNRQIINKSKILAENNININTNELINTNIKTETKSEINSITNETTGIETTTNTQTSLILALNDININANVIDNSNTLDIANNLNNINTGIISSNGIINLNIINTLNNELGNIVGNKVQVNFVEKLLIPQTPLSTLNSQLLTSETSQLSTQFTTTEFQPQTQTIFNTGGNIISSSDITLNILTDFIITGTIFSTNGNVKITAKNITNNSDILSGNNITLNSTGNIYNGSVSNLATIIAMNDIIFNILIDTTTNTGGNLYNYGKISANNNILINAENSVYNGFPNNSQTSPNNPTNPTNPQSFSNATISANNNLSIVAGRRIINNAYIQAIGKTDTITGGKIAGTGNITLTTKAKINDDYELGGLFNDSTNTNPDTSKDNQITAETQAKLDDINNITDLNELNNLLTQIKTEEQYYIVQNRIRVISIEETIDTLKNMYVYNPSEWEIGNIIEVEVLNSETGEYETKNIALTEEILQLKIQDLLNDKYKEEDWTINQNLLTQKETEIDNLIAEQNFRKQQAEENNEEFNETLLNKEQLIIEYTKVLQNNRLNNLKLVLNTEKNKYEAAFQKDWTSYTQEEQLNQELQASLGDYYSPQNWQIPQYQSSSSISLITDSYLSSLRINAIDKTKTEQTGIHNYGRIYSNNDMELNSNSVLHNNKNSLIHSNKDITFNINKVLFNNENNLGQGIYANNNINIQSNTINPFTNKNDKLEYLFNYDGRIESKNDINIQTNNIINYGSDNFDLSGVDKEPNVVLYKYSYGSIRGRKKIFGAYGIDNSKISTGAYQILSRYYGDKDAAFGDRTEDMKEYEEYAVISNIISNPSTLRSGNSININNTNNIINKNSNINSKDINIDTNNFLNYLTSFIVTTKTRYNERNYLCGGKCNVDITYYTNNVLYSKTPSEITASGNLNIKAKNMKNGGLIDKKDLENIEGKNIEIAKIETNLDKIINSGILNPLNFITLPQGNYGIFRKPTNPNSNYLFETDPTLIDTNLFLGSQYFMNRLGLDPNTIDLKFLGDSYMENQMLTRAIKDLESTNSYLKSTPSETYQEQIERMYANINKDLKNNLGLKFGEALTTEQQSKLDKDIIWYVKQDITIQDENGNDVIIKDVLVPQIYLSKENQDKLNNNLDILNKTGTMIAESTIAGNNIIIQGQTNSNNNSNNNSILNNSGTITANNNLLIQTDTINNITTSLIRGEVSEADRGVSSQATISAGNTLILDTGKNGTINNISGNITTTNTDSTNNKDSLLYLNTGTINNISGNIAVNSPDKATSALNPPDKGGSRGVSSQTNKSSNSSTLYINTGELNNITKTQQETKEHKGNGNEYKEVRTYIGDTATIQSNGNLIINAENDINLKGSDIIASNDAEITTNNGNINVDTIEDYNYTYEKTKVDGGLFGQTKTTIEENESLKNIGSNINTNGNLLINSKNDINIVGSNINSKGNAELNAGKDVNVISSVDKERTYNEVEKDGFAYNVLSINENLKMTNNKSIFNVGNDFNVKSGNNVNFVGVDVNAENGYINAGNEFNLFAVQDYEYDYSFYMKERIDWESIAIQGGLALLSFGAGYIAKGKDLINLSKAIYSSAGSAGVNAAKMLFDKKIYTKETETESTTQIKSELNFNNKFESYSENNSNIISSDIIAKNKDSKIKTSENSNVIILDLDNTYKSKTTKGKYNPAFNFNFSYGNAPENKNYTKDGFNTPDYYYDEKELGKTTTDQYITDISESLSEALRGIEDNFGFDFIKDEWNDSLRKAIKKQITAENIEKSIIKGLNNLLPNETSNSLSIKPREKEINSERINKACGDKCKIKIFEDYKSEKVNSIIKFGDKNYYE